MKMTAEDLEGSLGGIAGGMIMGGVLSGDMVYCLKNAYRCYEVRAYRME